MVLQPNVAYHIMANNVSQNYKEALIKMLGIHNFNILKDAIPTYEESPSDTIRYLIKMGVSPDEILEIYNEEDLTTAYMDEELQGDLNEQSDCTTSSNEEPYTLPYKRNMKQGSLYTSIVDQYFMELHKYKILTREEEFQYAILVQQGLSAQAQLEELNPPDDSKEHEILSSIIDEGLKAKNLLITHNLRFVASIARRFLKAEVSYIDLIQEGNMGLMHAVDRFDPYKGFRLTTYATCWITQRITRYLDTDGGRLIRLPVHVKERYRKIQYCILNESKILGRDPTTKEIAESLQMTEESVLYVLQHTSAIGSIDINILEDSDLTISDTISDENTPDFLEVVAKKELKTAMDTAMSFLDPREEDIIKRYYGLGNSRQHTLQELAEEYSLSRERINQIRKKGLRKLKHPKRASLLKDFYN